MNSEFAEVRPIPGLGYGVFAKKHIPKGTFLVEEAPILVTKQYSQSAREVHSFCEAYYKLSHDAKSVVNRLHCDPGRLEKREEQIEYFENWCRGHYINAGRTWNRLDPQVSAIVKELIRACAINDTNCAGANGGFTAVFPDFSRFNHSCDPNCGWGVWGRDRKLTVTAKGDIMPGQQLFVTYDWEASRKANATSLEERRERLLGWGFLCACTRCMEEERTGMQVLPTWSSSNESSQPSTIARSNSEDELSGSGENLAHKEAEVPQQHPVFQSWQKSRFPTAEEIMDTLRGFKDPRKNTQNPSLLHTVTSDPEIYSHKSRTNRDFTKDAANLFDQEWDMSAANRSHSADI